MDEGRCTVGEGRCGVTEGKCGVGHAVAVGEWQGWCQCGGLGRWCPEPKLGAMLTPTWTSTPTPTLT